MLPACPLHRPYWDPGRMRPHSSVLGPGGDDRHHAGGQRRARGAVLRDLRLAAPAVRRGPRRRCDQAACASSASAGIATSATIARNHSWPASVPSPRACTRPSEPRQRGEPVELAPPHRPDPTPGVVGQTEQDQAPAADDPERGPDRLVARDERDRDVGDRRVQERVAEQRDAVDDDRDDRRERERVMSRAQIGRSCP